MEGNSFWLIYIQEDQVSVSLVSSTNGKFHVSSVGPSKNWGNDDSEQLIASVDESLSVASLNANITESEEPSTAAFVVPPFWVGSDGKILPQKLKHIKEICKKLAFTPTGFLAEDEALVEDSNKSDDLPSSCILVHLSQNEFYLSLVYLGHIKERIRKAFSGEFTGQLLESTLLEIKTESTLPPQIILFGQTNSSLISSIKSYPWVGKKNIETFLHLPDVNLYSDNDLITTFTRVISSQMSRNISNNPQVTGDYGLEEPETSEIETADESKTTAIKTNPENQSKLESSEFELVEASPTDFGFSLIQDLKENPIELSEQKIITSQIPEPNLDPFEPSVILPPVLPLETISKEKISFNFLKKIKFPKINFNFNIFWIILIILPFLAIIPFVFASANITLFVNPYRFEKTIETTLKTDTSDSDIASLIIPVKKETFNLDVKATVETTGQKTIGEKAKGEITIYNKLDKSQNIPKGSILTDASGKKFELTTAVSIASSSSDLSQGIITLGQTKTVVIAADIGPEFNISSGSPLNFKDYPSTSLIAKVENDFSGGAKQQIKAVSQSDKTAIQSKIDEEITKAIENKVNQTVDNISGVIKETIQSDKGNLNLSREIGEAAEELSGTVTASVSVFTIFSSTKEAIIKQILSNEADFNKINLDLNNFSLGFKVKKITSNQATATLTISGQSLPKIDTSSIQKALSVKTIKQSGETIKKLIPRAYNFHIESKLPLLPFNSKNINIEIKTESL